MTIPRKLENGDPISASRVRALLKEGDFEEIGRLVPESTLIYLRNRFGPTVKTTNETIGNGEKV